MYVPLGFGFVCMGTIDLACPSQNANGDWFAYGVQIAPNCVFVLTV